MVEKKRKLIVATIGAGDPTFIVNFKVSYKIGNVDETSIQMKTKVSLYNNSLINNTGDIESFEFLGQFPTNENILIGKSFTKNLFNDTPQAAEDTSSALELTFYEDGNEDIFEIDQKSTKVLATKEVNFNQAVTGVLHFTSNEEAGNLVFLQAKQQVEVSNSVLTTDSSFISCEDVYMFTISPILGTDYHSIYSVKEGMYLGATTGNRDPFTFSSKTPNPDSDFNFQWNIISVLANDNNTTVHQILNIGQGKYLSVDSADTGRRRVNTSSESDNTWYLHIPPTD